MEQYYTGMTKRLGDMQNALLAWFMENKRALPWRKDRDAYHVWISEIMLQQTRIEAAKPYYERFIKELPDMASLAAVEETKLLKLWEGLGYYSRARNLKKAAEICMEKYGGKLPESYHKLLTLPGIGSYTAGAISSIAFGEKQPVVDGNVLRVGFRLAGITDDVADPAVKKRTEESLRQWMKGGLKGDAGLFNQAVMELGECVCLPSGEPLCPTCPLRDACVAYAAGNAKLLPRRSPKRKREICRRTVFLITDGEHLLIHRRGDTGLLAGLYELPAAEEWQDLAGAEAFTAELLGMQASLKPLTEAKHIFTHKEWHMHAWLATVPGIGKERLIRLREQAYLFPFFAEIWATYPLPSAFGAWSGIWRKNSD